jgi:hypothetical protein
MKFSKARGNPEIANAEPLFALLVEQVFSLDPGIRWIALEEAAREPIWAWRNPETGFIHGGTTSQPSELVDPLLFMIAEGHEDLSSQKADLNNRLLFVVLAYEELVQVVARCGQGAHITVAADRRTDAYLLGTKLSDLLHRWADARVVG